MTDFDSIWHKQDEIRTVVDAVIGCGIWNLAYNQRRDAIELELDVRIDEETADKLCNQFTIAADYDGVGTRGTKFVFWV